MDMHMGKNYHTDEGDRLVIGGTLEFGNGAKVENFPGAANQAASTASDVRASPETQDSRDREARRMEPFGSSLPDTRIHAHGGDRSEQRPCDRGSGWIRHHHHA